MYERVITKSDEEKSMKSLAIKNDETQMDYSLEESTDFYLKWDELVGVVSCTMCQFTQEIVAFPINNLYIASQIMSNPYPNYYFPWTVFNSLYSSYLVGGGTMLWKGFPSYIILSGLISVGDTFLCFITQKYIFSRWLSSPLLFLERCLANFLIAPFYTTVLVDCILSDSVNGIRGPLFFVIEGTKLLLSRRRRYRNYSFSYLSSRPLNLYQRFVTYTIVIFSRCLINNIIYRFFSYFLKRKQIDINSVDNNNKTVTDELNIDSYQLNHMCTTTYTKYSDKMTLSFVTSVTTDILMMPIVTSGVKCLLQGLDLFVDNFSKQSVDIIGSKVLPASQTYFKDIIDCITTTYEESGFIGGFCKGFGAIILGSVVKYCVVRIFKKWLQFYYQRNATAYHESITSSITAYENDYH